MFVWLTHTGETWINKQFLVLPCSIRGISSLQRSHFPSSGKNGFSCAVLAMVASKPRPTAVWMDVQRGRQISSPGSRMGFKEKAERKPQFLLFQMHISQEIRLQNSNFFFQRVKCLNHLSNNWSSHYIASILVFTVLKCVLTSLYFLEHRKGWWHRA